MIRDSAVFTDSDTDDALGLRRSALPMPALTDVRGIEMRVLDNREDIPEWIKHRSHFDPAADIFNRFVRPRAEREQAAVFSVSVWHAP